MGGHGPEAALGTGSSYRGGSKKVTMGRGLEYSGIIDT